ncbi:conserved protein of unknown function [Acidithiobacillus ferrivorans]|uniref:Uncharacterized protein n=1 Tax=Acidithiobacillus ferrivorans TaxID=160808 RepID=A0A060UK11_9PROT|nr:conserved hypothetical protein [Acidithiobacillus ferrivorans]SMH64236.1 conserved protein of unknown function [Acidithiobacillus ferrivorans]
MLEPQKIKIFLEICPDEKTADIAFSLVEKVTAVVVKIIGKDGFNALYARSLSLTVPTFPWLAVSVMTLQDDDMLVLLKNSFVAQPPAAIRVASSLLLITFSDILCQLVGDQLTARILHDAFGGEIVEAVLGERRES